MGDNHSKIELDLLLSSTNEKLPLPLHSAGGLNINAIRICKESSAASKKLLFIGGVHGNEKEGVFLVEKYTEKLRSAPKDNLEIIAIPIFNPDGYEMNVRKNANEVDLNRNLPTKDWSHEFSDEKYHPGETSASEPENTLLMAIVEIYQPDYIISVHSWEPLINYNGPSKLLAEKMAESHGYKVTDDVGYPTPGSLGTWAGTELNIPTITLEVKRGISDDENWKINEKTMDAAIDFILNNN